MKRSLAIGLSALIGVCAIVYILNYIAPRLRFPETITIQTDIGRYNAAIYTYDMREQSFTRLTPTDVAAYCPAWSPDGQHLAYVYWTQDHKKGISLLNKEGGEPISNFPVTSEDDFRLDPRHGQCLAWSPDNRQILFYTFPQHGKALYLLDIDTGQVTRPAIALDIKLDDSLSFTWSNAGLAVEVDDRIYLVDLETGAVTFLVEGSAPFWKPDGETLTYSCTGHGRWYGLCTFSLVSGEKSVLYQPKACCIGVREGVQWTSDGRFIVYRESSGESDPIYLTILDTKTGHPYRVDHDSLRWYLDKVALPPQ